jgi:hypothetical protein
LTRIRARFQASRAANSALNVLDGSVFGHCMQRHRHQEFLRFLNAIERTVTSGGWGGIRTHEGREPLPVFKTGAFNRSATHPRAYATDVTWASASFNRARREERVRRHRRRARRPGRESPGRIGRAFGLTESIVGAKS